MRNKLLLSLALTAMSWISAAAQHTDSIPNLEPVDSIAGPVAESDIPQPHFFSLLY